MSSGNMSNGDMRDISSYSNGPTQPFGGDAEQAAMSERMAEPAVAAAMITAVPAVPPWITVKAARQVAALKSAAHLLVEEEGRLMGLVSVRDLDRAGDDDPVAAWSCSPALFVGPGTGAARACEMMAKNRVACLPVIAGAFLVGVVTRQALERALARPSVSGGRSGKRRGAGARRAAA
jgi:CBS domain-containing protein